MSLCRSCALAYGCEIKRECARYTPYEDEWGESIVDITDIHTGERLRL